MRSAKSSPPGDGSEARRHARRDRRSSLVAAVAINSRWGHTDRVEQARAGLLADAALEAIEAITLPVTSEDAERLWQAVEQVPVKGVSK